MRSVVIALLLLFSQFAHAETPREKAKELYRKAAQSYDFGEYQKALEGFKAAYAEVEDPAILFNIAQCHRQLGQKVEAVRVYKSFLRKAPNSPGQADVKDLVAKLERAIADEQSLKIQPPQGNTPNEPSRSFSKSRSRQRRRSSSRSLPSSSKSSHHHHPRRKKSR